MSHARVAVVQLKIHWQKLKGEDFSAIEALLRGRGDVTITQLDEEDMRFLMFGEGELDYRILDQIKNELQVRKFTSFVLTADEYAWSGEKYRYTEGASAQ